MLRQIALWDLGTVWPFFISYHEVVRKTRSQLDAQNIPIKPIRHHTAPDPTQTTSIQSIQLKLCSNREIGHFYIVVVQWRQINVQKVWCTCESCCFANLSLLLYSRSRCRRSYWPIFSPVPCNSPDRFCESQLNHFSSYFKSGEYNIPFLFQ